MFFTSALYLLHTVYVYACTFHELYSSMFTCPKKKKKQVTHT